MADTQLLTGHRSRHCGIGPIDCIERGVTTPEQNCQCETDAVPVIHIWVGICWLLTRLAGEPLYEVRAKSTSMRS